MHDRQTLFTEAGFLLRRMHELSEDTTAGRRPLERIHAEAEQLQRRWRSVIDGLQHWDRLPSRPPPSNRPSGKSSGAAEAT
jgi:hypothetical protein